LSISAVSLTARGLAFAELDDFLLPAIALAGKVKKTPITRFEE